MNEYDQHLERLNQLYDRLKELNGLSDVDSIRQRVQIEREIKQVRRGAILKKESANVHQ